MGWSVRLLFLSACQRVVPPQPEKCAKTTAHEPRRIARSSGDWPREQWQLEASSASSAASAVIAAFLLSLPCTHTHHTQSNRNFSPGRQAALSTCTRYSPSTYSPTTRTLSLNTHGSSPPQQSNRCVAFASTFLNVFYHMAPAHVSSLSSHDTTRSRPFAQTAVRHTTSLLHPLTHDPHSQPSKVSAARLLALSSPCRSSTAWTTSWHSWPSCRTTSCLLVLKVGAVRWRRRRRGRRAAHAAGQRALLRRLGFAALVDLLAAPL